MSLAVALTAAGQKEEALSHFAKAVPIMTNRSRQSDDESTSDRERNRRVQLGLEPYIGLLVDIRGAELERKAGIDAVVEAFRIANTARSGSVQEALAASGARSLASNLDLSNLVRREQDTRKQTAALYALLPDLLSAPTDQQDPKAVNDLKVRIDNLRGARANEGVVKTRDLSGYKVLAFATHGLAPGDLNGLTQPALALSASDVAGVEGDGLLTMGEILGFKLDADWVVLSACNTGSGAGAGAEAVSGLGQAFFYAGTRALLVSNWPVETTSAKTLTTDLFRRQAKDASLSRAQALQHAMLALIDGGGYVNPKSGKTVFSYAHPIFWAPFTLIGDGGVGKPFSYWLG